MLPEAAIAVPARGGVDLLVVDAETAWAPVLPSAIAFRPDVAPVVRTAGCVRAAWADGASIVRSDSELEALVVQGPEAASG